MSSLSKSRASLLKELPWSFKASDGNAKVELVANRKTRQAGRKLHRERLGDWILLNLVII